MIKTEILKIKGTWDEVLDACRSTVSKKFLGKDPSEEFKRRLVVNEHSPLRCLIYKWRWSQLPSYLATHFARHHEGFEKWISTQRNDRQQNYDRRKAPQDAPVEFIGEGNGQALINMSKVRLCTCADPETRKQMEDLKRTIYDEADKNVGWAMVPACIYRAGCPEMSDENKCRFYENFLKKHPEITVNSTIWERYDAYNKDFFS